MLGILAANGQTTQKYNIFYERTEFYDTYGNMIGYAKENTFYKRIEYYDAQGNLIKYEKKMSSESRIKTVRLIQ